MKERIDIENWARKDHYRFFSGFEEPFFGVTVQVDCSTAYERSKANGYSFFLSYLHASLKAANQIEAFRYRISDKEVWLHDIVHASPTINRPDGTFGFAYMDYDPDFESFQSLAQIEIRRVQNATGLDPALSGENVIHYSSIPWIHFTALSHARSFSHKDSIPKISFGKIEDVGGRRMMPMSVHAHHGLMDGYQVGLYVDLFQTLMHG